MKPHAGPFARVVFAILALGTPVAGWAAEEAVTTVVYARIGNGYKREKAKDGSPKPEYYALSNGGRIYGTSSDSTIDRVTYPEVAEIAGRLLQQQNYLYSPNKQQAQLLLVLNWGATIAYNNPNYGQAVRILGKEVALQSEKAMYLPTGAPDSGGVNADALLEIQMENRVRDGINLPNARILGYLDAINAADGIQRWAGGGDRYKDLLTDIEEPRYYIVISAYDFPELEQSGTRKLLWQTRVSVRSAGNSFDRSFVPMLKSASKYFGRDSGRLIRGEETNGTVEMGELNFLGEARVPAVPAAAPKK